MVSLDHLEKVENDGSTNMLLQLLRSHLCQVNTLLAMVDQMLQNSTKKFYAFNERTIFIQRIIYIFNERNIFDSTNYLYIQRNNYFDSMNYVFNEMIILIQRIIYSTK